MNMRTKTCQLFAGRSKGGRRKVSLCFLRPPTALSDDNRARRIAQGKNRTVPARGVSEHLKFISGLA